MLDSIIRVNIKYLIVKLMINLLMIEINNILLRINNIKDLTMDLNMIMMKTKIVF